MTAADEVQASPATVILHVENEDRKYMTFDSEASPSPISAYSPEPSTFITSYMGKDHRGEPTKIFVTLTRRATDQGHEAA